MTDVMKPALAGTTTRDAPGGSRARKARPKAKKAKAGSPGHAASSRRSRRGSRPDEQQPFTLFDLAGQGILMQGEDPAFWGAIHDGIHAAVEPADTLEAFWVSNMACLAHEVIRYRAMRDGLLNSRRHDGLQRLVGSRLTHEAMNRLRLRYSLYGTRDPETRAALKELGIDEDDITAATFHVCLDDTERYERLILHAEARLHVAQREMDARRLVRRRLEAALPSLIEDAVRARIAGVRRAGERPDAPWDEQRHGGRVLDAEEDDPSRPQEAARGV